MYKQKNLLHSGGSRRNYVVGCLRKTRWVGAKEDMEVLVSRERRHRSGTNGERN